jgi:uncharacterized repeat protein (TIGR01451 family)
MRSFLQSVKAISHRSTHSAISLFSVAKDREIASQQESKSASHISKATRQVVCHSKLCHRSLRSLAILLVSPIFFVTVPNVGTASAQSATCPVGSISTTFDWGTVSYPAGSVGPVTYSNVGNSGTNITVQTDNSSGHLAKPGYPTVASGFSNTGKSFLYIGMSSVPVGSGIGETISFSQAIDKLSFALYDVDKDPTGWTDVVTVTGYLGATAVIPVLTKPSTGTASISGNTATGTTNVPTGNNAGDVFASFSTPVDRVVVQYKQGSGSTNPSTSQFIGMFPELGFCAPTYTIQGNVFDDLDGSKIKAVSGENYTAANITAVLLDASSKVVSTTAVDATGNYTLSSIPAGSYTVKIIQKPATTLTTGVTIPVANDILPTNWVATGENNNGTPDATIDRTQTVTVASANITNINFGIEQLPDTTALTPPSQTNPGGTATVPVTTLAGTDPEDGALGTGKTFKIVTLPTNADLYYNGTKITTPNFVIANYDPTKLLVDPNDGTITVSFTYAAVDAAGQQDSTSATVTMPFTPSSSPANLLLVKRITAINGTPLNVYKDDTDNTALHAADDNNVNWPTPLNTNTALGDTTISTFLRGAIDGGKVKPGDTIEYTIYFLNAGGSNASNLRVCDRIIDSQKFLSGSTIQLQKNSTTPTLLTSVSGDDRATFYASSGDPAITNCNFTSTPTIDNGAIVVDVTGATGSPTWTTLPGSTGAGTTDTYGLIRFTTKVNQ